MGEGTEIKSTVQASAVVAELGRDDVDNAYTLRDTRVAGALDLRHLVVKRPIDIQGCEFADVDARYCEFKQTVNLSDCVFRGQFNSGDETQSHALYAKDLICKGVTFQGLASFNGCRVEGSAYFSKAKFEGTQKPVDFTTAYIGNTLECDEAIFSGSVNLAVKCGGSGFFSDARFESEEGVYFNSASFDRNLICDRTVFKGPADFELLRCGNGGFFRKARFEGEGEVKFVQASFGSNIECIGATFAGPVTFNSLRCNLVGIFHGATFHQEADFAYAFFHGNLQCHDAEFSKVANFGSIECRNFDCTHAKFRGPAVFNKLRCNDSGYFDRAEFSSFELVDFNYASFETILQCEKTVFNGPTSFASLKCAGSTHIKDAQFRHPGGVTFLRSSFDSNLELHGASFQSKAEFTSIRCGGDVICMGSSFHTIDFRFASIEGTLYLGPRAISPATIALTTFRGAADFTQLVCGKLNCRYFEFGGPANFSLVKVNSVAAFQAGIFNTDANFAGASFGGTLECASVLFRGLANFDTMRCGVSASFRGINFNRADFSHARLGKHLNCTGATFWGTASFVSLKCGQSGLFNRAVFKGDTNFSLASFGENLECMGEGTVFERGVLLNQVKCDGSGLFDAAQFLSPFKPERIDFGYSHFGLNLSLRDARIAGDVDMSMSHVNRRLSLTNSRFRQDCILRGAEFGLLEIEGDTLPFKRARLDLRECSFGRFLGDKAMALKLARAQDPSKFSRDPYLQLENYYESTGDEVTSKRFHHQGRSDLRENAKDKRRGVTKWSRPTLWFDWWIKWLTGYGVRTARLLAWIGAWLFVGMLVYWPDNAVDRLATTVETEAVPKGQVSWMQPFDPLEYSVDLFLPVVNLHVEEQWEPRGFWRQQYSFVHAIAGWLLIPLLVASVAGIVRRQ